MLLSTEERADALAGELAAARLRLKDRLAQVDLAGLGVSEYNQRYLGRKLHAVDGALRETEQLLMLGLADAAVPLDEFTMLDYGGGSGLISLLAKELGVGTVVYNDIYDVSCEDVRRISAAIGLPLDHVVCGDIDDVVAYLGEHSLELDGVVSYDVLEHIYDVGAHFRSLAAAPGSFRIVYGSGANIKNPRYVRATTKVHVRNELEGTTPEWGHKERDTVRPFLEIRRELIAAAAPELREDEVDSLARATRGLRQDDVERAVAEYVERGSITYRPDHPTNTCDPYTGNWSEHLMEPSWLEEVVSRAGFAVEIRAGRYVVDGGREPKTVAKRALNAAIGALGARALPVAPYYVVYGTKRAAA